MTCDYTNAVMQGKHAKSTQGNIATSQPAAVVVRGPSTAHDGSVGNRTDQQRRQQAQSSTNIFKLTAAAAKAAVLNSTVADYAEMEGTKLGDCPDRPEVSAAHGSAGTAQQGTVSSCTSAGTAQQRTVNSLTSAGTAGEDMGEHTPSAEAASQALHIPAAQPSGSPPSTPSWQRTCPGQPPTPLSSHPIADELTASSDSLTSSGDATLLGQLTHGQAHADLPATVTVPDTTQQPRTEPGDTATSQGTQHVMSAATAAGPPLLDTSAVLLQFSHALDEDRLLSPASTAASERVAPPQPLPPPAAASPLFCRNTALTHAAGCMLSAGSSQGTAKSPEATANGPQDIASSLQGGCSLQSLADMPDYAHAVSEPWRPIVNEADGAAALSFLALTPPSSSALSSPTSSSLGSADTPAASSAQDQLGATQAAYCTAAEQLQSAVQQATKLYTTAFPPAELTAGSDSQHNMGDSEADHTAIFDSMQQAFGSSHTEMGQASDSLVTHAIRRMPSTSSSAAAAWVPQGGQASMVPCAVNLSHDQHDSNTGEG